MPGKVLNLCKQNARKNTHSHLPIDLRDSDLCAVFVVLQLEFNQQKHYQETYNTTKFVIKCKYCGKEHERNKSKYPAQGKIGSN